MPDVFVAPKKAHHPSTHKRKTKSESISEADGYSSVLRLATKSPGAFAAFSPKPHNVSFEVQHEDEPILLLLRQHPIVNLGWMILALVMIVIPFFVAPFVPVGLFPAAFHTIAWLGWYTITFGFILENFLIWFFNIYIITDERVIDVDFYNLLFKKISEAKIENIEDITSSNAGFLQSILDYGQVRVQTSAEIPQIEFENVPHPSKVAKFLSEMLLQEEQEKIEGRVR